jgi:predicted DNA-binding transcriptional regulator AlpA
MAEATAGQASFGWASETAAPGEKRPAARRTRTPVRRQSSSAAAPQRIAANAGETQLPPDNELWDVRAAAKFLKRSVSWVYHKAEDGTLPVKRLGGWGLRFIPSELRTWVETGGAAKPR